MADIIQQRRDTAARWAQYNPILLEGEVGYVTDNPNQYKIGNGVSRWNDLPLRGYTGTITQEKGNDENAVMSQAAVTKELSELGSEVSALELEVKGGRVYSVELAKGILTNTGYEYGKRMTNYIPVNKGDVVVFNIKRPTNNIYIYGHQGYHENKNIDGYLNFSPPNKNYSNTVLITRDETKWIRFDFSEVDANGNLLAIGNESMDNSDFEVIIKKQASLENKVNEANERSSANEKNISLLDEQKKNSADDVVYVLRKELEITHNQREGLINDGKGGITYTIQQSDSGVVNIDLLLKSANPNPYTNGRYVNMKTYTNGSGKDCTVFVLYYNSNNSPMTNQYIGVVSNVKDNKGISALINNQFQDTTIYVGLRITINTSMFNVGDIISISDIGLSEYYIGDYRGTIVENNYIQEHETIENIKNEIADINSKLSQEGKVEDITPIVTESYWADTYQTRYGGSTGSANGYSVSDKLYNIEGVYKIEFYNTMQNSTQANSSIVFFKTNNRTQFVYAPVYHRTKKDVIYKGQWGDAKYIGISWKDSLRDDFYIKLYYGGDEVSDGTKIQMLNRLEDAVLMKSQSEIVNVGTFMMRKTGKAVGISNTNTQVSGYTPIGVNSKEGNECSVLNTYEDLPYVYHIGRYTGKVYYNGGDHTYLNVSDSMEDFLQGRGRRCCKDYIVGISGVREMSNCELVIITQLVESTRESCGILVTTDWALKSKTNEECTAVLRQKWLAGRNSPQDAWGFHVCGNKILVSEYAPNSSPNTFTNSYVYYSNDFGKSFKVVFDIESQFGVPSERETPVDHQHIHGCCIDNYWNRLWVLPGESSPNDIALSYSDDEGETWVHLSSKNQEKVISGGSYMWLKFCSAHALSTGVILGTDAQPNSIWRFNRISKDYEEGVTESQIEEVKRFDIGEDHISTITHIMGHMTRVIGSSSELPCVVSVPFVGRSSLVSESNETGIVYITYDGIRFWEVWREKDPNFKSVDNFGDNGMKSYLYPNGKIYIFTNYKDSKGVGHSRIIEGFIDV